MPVSEERKKQMKENYIRNKEKIRKQQKYYYSKNRDSLIENMKEYIKTENGIKSHRIGNWKNKGVKCENFDELYEKFINTTHCEECKTLLTTDRYTTHTTKCLDHNHETGEFRNILCNLCNIKRR